MKTTIWLLALLALWVGAGNSQPSAMQPETYVIRQPTIVAFFPPVTRPVLESDDDSNEALSDFQFYARQVRTHLEKAGIDFREADARSFRIRMGTNVRIFQTGKIGIGYYLVAPGKKPHIEYGVMTDTDLLDVARKYFGIAIP